MGIYSSNRLICIYYNGNSDGNIGSPHRIIVYNFILKSDTDGFIKFLISNPDGNSLSPLRIKFKGFGKDTNPLNGKSFYGEWELENGFDLGAYETAKSTIGNI